MLLIGVRDAIRAVHGAGTGIANWLYAMNAGVGLAAGWFYRGPSSAPKVSPLLRPSKDCN